MFFKQKSNTFIRIFDEIGYIVNNSNFRDSVTDASGAVFLKALSRKPKSLEDMSTEIAQSFVDVNVQDIKNDAYEFFTSLENDGFIISGENEFEINKKDIAFSYEKLLGNEVKNNLSLLTPKQDTQSYLEKHFKNKPQLMSFQVELTSRCNERCIHCYIPHTDKDSDIEAALFFDILQQCREMNVLDITLSGGEPMLHPEFCNFVQKAKEYDFYVTVLSNLTQLNDEIISVMKNGILCSIQTSIYSMDPAIHDSITMLPGSFEKTKNNVLTLIENNIPVQINCPTMKQNKYCYKDVLSWAHEHKCKSQSDFIMFARYDHSIDNLDNRLSLNEVNNVITDIVNNDIEYQQLILSTEYESLYNTQKDISDNSVCGVCKTMSCMTANGNVYPCPGWHYILGNVKETPLSEIWEKSQKVQYLRNLRKKDFPECPKCIDREFCVICMARNDNENNDIFKISKHFCEVAAINRKVALDWKAKHTTR